MDKSELKERLKQCEEEELSLVFPAFNYADAWEVGMLLAENAKQKEAPVAVEIEMNGTEIFHYTFPGAAEYNNMWLTRKKNMVRM